MEDTVLQCKNNRLFSFSSNAQMLHCMMQHLVEAVSSSNYSMHNKQQ